MRQSDDTTSLVSRSQLIWESTLLMVQALSKAGLAPRLALITRGAVSVSGEAVPGIAMSLLWGIGKSIALEHPELHCLRVDLDPEPQPDEVSAIMAELSRNVSQQTEDQVAFRGEHRYVARLTRRGVRTDGADTELLDLPQTESYALGVPEGGTVEALAWQPAQRRAPGAGEVEIAVRTAGLNFKDVLLALCMIPDVGPVLGGECAGEVVRVGAGVTHVAVGEAVLAMAPGSFARYVTVPACAVARLPAGLSFEAAATIPVAFLTAVYALEEVARVQAGERVLIHAAAGGVGQAAIQVAQRAGAEIFATASASKWEVVRGLGVRQVMDSRTLEFGAEVRRLTQGAGVDVVLNSLGGEFTRQSVALLRAGGRFLELGIREGGVAGEVAELAPGAVYEAIDLLAVYQEQPEVVRRVLGEVVAGLAAGELRALPYTVFPVEGVKEAFRMMQQAKHTGKLVLSFAQAPPLHFHATSRTPSRATWIDQLERTPVARRRAVLTSLLREEISSVLEIGTDDHIAPRQRLFDLGLDSLMAVELKNRLSSALVCSFSTTLLFDYPTLEALVDHLCTALPSLAFDISATVEPTPAAAALDDKKAALDQLSQAELEDLLAEKLSALAE